MVIWCFLYRDSVLIELSDRIANVTGDDVASVMLLPDPVGLGRSSRKRSDLEARERCAPSGSILGGANTIRLARKSSFREKSDREVAFYPTPF